MEAFAKTLSARRARVITHVATGDPADVILEFVASHAPSLVAMSTHGTSGPSRWIRGSVAERVLRHCSVPLLMANPQGVQPTGRLGFRKVLVPIDGSDTASQILPLVKQLAPHYESEVILICVEAPRVAVTPMAAPPPPADEGALAAKTLEPYLSELRGAGLKVRSKTPVGPAAEWIIRTAESEEVDLLAMTTHGRSGPSRWLFGSVAEKVLRKSPCPLLVRRTTRTK
jgi:nucleotide-binding universal stress UspA family protein